MQGICVYGSHAVIAEQTRWVSLVGPLWRLKVMPRLHSEPGPQPPNGEQNRRQVALVADEPMH